MESKVNVVDDNIMGVESVSINGNMLLYWSGYKSTVIILNTVIYYSYSSSHIKDQYELKISFLGNDWLMLCDNNSIIFNTLNEFFGNNKCVREVV